MMLLALGLLLQDPAPFDPAVHEATRTFGFEDFRIVPVRVHLLRSARVDPLNTRLQEADVRRIFGKANRIWNRAGVALDVESIVDEPAADEGFDAARGPEAWKAARPEASRGAGLIHVYYVHELATNGIYMGADAIFVKDTAALRPAKGGVDEPLPRVTSHEIGHALDLPHRQATINLMASGTTGWSLDDAEIDRARTWASRRDWIRSPADALTRGRHEILASLPGTSRIKDAAVEALNLKKKDP
jgi:hypothetical protein